MTQTENSPAWPDHKPTALLVLADGTVLEGFGLGAEGQAVGEVCFNTAMTGYEEILTDPPMPGSSSPSPFRISAMSASTTRNRDREHGGDAGRARCDPAQRHHHPSNYRASRHLDQWLRARGIIGISGIDTRALTALIRNKGMRTR